MEFDPDILSVNHNEYDDMLSAYTQTHSTDARTYSLQTDKHKNTVTDK